MAVAVEALAMTGKSQSALWVLGMQSKFALLLSLRVISLITLGLARYISVGVWTVAELEVLGCSLALGQE